MARSKKPPISGFEFYIEDLRDVRVDDARGDEGLVEEHLHRARIFRQVRDYT